ncbi:DUF5709 domain-containing protein [Rhodococcus sp. HNM0569]|uniref:DUF5709 domain-containing protein n=1 Tax=Rhodococcus sp. HNM0569 TaxID=2716340 RepID=UPI00146F0A45|nr:DUF5709 domain-containing protein [Rhodococcus sp. HNM0569]NLU83105.1 hypothetical protein [Rhodococcus sp. HNM0569]
MSQDADSTPEGSEGEYSLDEDDQLQPEDTLEDIGVDDVLDRGYSPPDRPLGVDKYGVTDAEQERGESLDQKLAEEVPDTPLADDDEPDGEEPEDTDEVTEGYVSGDPEYVEDYEVGDERSGRLVAEDEGFGADTEADLVADDVGIDSAAASAEEAAVHTVDDEDEAELGRDSGE